MTFLRGHGTLGALRGLAPLIAASVTAAGSPNAPYGHSPDPV